LLSSHANYKTLPSYIVTSVDFFNYLLCCRYCLIITDEKGPPPLTNEMRIIGHSLMGIIISYVGREARTENRSTGKLCRCACSPPAFESWTQRGPQVVSSTIKYDAKG
jgi:hypothetical protein